MALVATDIAARGIDVAALPSVVNFELPNVPETYVHRIGRTGRAGRTGVAVSLCDIDEKEYLTDIEKLIGKKVAEADENPFPMTVFEKSPPKTPGKRPAKTSPAPGNVAKLEIKKPEIKEKTTEVKSAKSAPQKQQPKPQKPQKPQFPGKKRDNRGEKTTDCGNANNGNANNNGNAKSGNGNVAGNGASRRNRNRFRRRNNKPKSE